MDKHMQQARRYARILLRWHREIGAGRTASTQPRFLGKYLERVQMLQALDLDRPENVLRIVDEQRRGVFLFFAGDEIPVRLWEEHAEPIDLPAATPRTLEGLASAIAQLLKAVPRSSFVLPERWADEPVPLLAATALLSLQAGETARQALRTYFAPLAATERLRIAGCELLVAMNEAILDTRRVGASDCLPALGPAAFHFALATGAGTLVSEALRGHIAIEKVRLGGAAPAVDTIGSAATCGLVVTLTVANRRATAAQIRVPAGSAFEVTSVEPGVQNLVVTEDYLVQLAPQGRRRVAMQGRCLNRALRPPEGVPGRATPFRFRGPNYDQETIWAAVGMPEA